MSAHINGKKVKAAYINGKEILQIYDSGKLVWYKYFPKGYELIIGWVDNYTDNDDHLYLDRPSVIIGSSGDSTTWEGTDYTNTGIHLSDETLKKFAPKKMINLKYRANPNEEWVDEGNKNKDFFAGYCRLSYEFNYDAQVKLTIL